VETCSNSSPSSSTAFHVAMGTCSVKPRPADGQIAAFSCHVTLWIFLFIISEMEEFTYQDHALSCGDISKTWPDICSKLWLVCRLLNYPLAWIVPTQLTFLTLPLMYMILQSGCVKLGVLLNIKTAQHNDWFLSVIWTNSMKIYLKMTQSIKISLKMAIISIKPYMEFCYLKLPITFSLLPLLCPSNQTPEQCLPSDHCWLGCEPASLCIWATQHVFQRNQNLGIHYRFHLTDLKNWSYRKKHCEAT
jgi:hypothetical protein